MTTENIVMRNTKGVPMSIGVQMKEGKVVGAYNYTTSRKYSLTGAKRIYGGHQKGYRFMADVYGKSETVTIGARTTYKRMFKQKIPIGRPPKTRRRDTDKRAIGKRTQAILRRIREIKNVSHKSALKTYRYLKTVCGGHHEEYYGDRMIKISRGLSWGDERVYYVFYDEQSPTYVMTDGEQFEPIFWRAADLYYGEVLDETMTMEDVYDRFLSTMDFERGKYDPDTIVFLGLAVYDQP